MRTRERKKNKNLHILYPLFSTFHIFIYFLDRNKGNILLSLPIFLFLIIFISDTRKLFWSTETADVNWYQSRHQFWSIFFLPRVSTSCGCESWLRLMLHLDYLYLYIYNRAGEKRVVMQVETVGIVKFWNVMVGDHRGENPVRGQWCLSTTRATSLLFPPLTFFIFYILYLSRSCFTVNLKLLDEYFWGKFNKKN